MHPPSPSHMLLSDVWAVLEERVFTHTSSDRLFNFYKDGEEALDLPDGPAIRRQNLKSYLSCFRERPPVLLLAEAPGPWGCRFSGVPITSESQLLDAHFPVRGMQSSTGA